MSHTYYYVPPIASPPFKKVIRRTRGAFVRVTDPTGCFGFRYAIFRNRSSEVHIPIHDLTPETKATIGI